ncbi:pyridoxal-phosphate-dependent aminotransferase family protein [Fusobacterium sp.]|uniref:pyridoxal-phosphate-dependent aminotransferase family protein n=1 Tax=Fusobacterium sp. TaxID=68766 RepID=UPI00396C4EA9
MINFTVGPVQSHDIVRKIGAEQVPYFRTPEFSEVMLENEAIMKKISNAEDKARVVFLTASGTGAMEAAVINTITENDKVLIVNSGSFGQRFVDICKIYDIDYDEIKIEYRKCLKAEELEKYENKDYTVFLVNIHETSTGVYHNLEMISEFCKRNNIFLIVDGISSFLADPFDMEKSRVDILITSSQKALACPPGISVLVLSENALERIQKKDVKCMYLNLKSALSNGERGQTPFTPAVGILLQINARLKEIIKKGGVEKEIENVQKLALDFREKIKELPFEFFSESMSNAVTALCPLTASPKEIFTILKDEYKIWVCPNGGELGEKIFRVGHIGNLTLKDNETLIEALKDLKRRGII